MQTINKVIIKNFKFFFGEVEFNFEQKPNMLLFGGNGSGKSSLYWSLYTFLQSVFKTDDSDIQKYFDPADQHNLINKFSAANAPSEISIEYIEADKTKTTKTISYATINTKSGDIVRNTTLASDFVNYRLLSSLYNWSHTDEINLFPLFENDLLMFITFSGGLNAGDYWQIISRGLNPRPNMSSAAYRQFQERISFFNDQFVKYLNKIIETANEYLQDKFKEPLKILFSYEKCSYDDFYNGSTTKRNHKVSKPRITLTISYKHDLLSGGQEEIKRPHSFMNEARLTSIALAIRFAIIDEKYIDIAPKILVLDDLLISLDMSNRDTVLDIILDEFKEYQILMMTHDRLFFEIAKHKISKRDKDNWELIEMFDTTKDGVPQPFIKRAESYLDKANKFFCLKEYEIAGNQLRKDAESFCKSFLPKRAQYNHDYALFDLNGLITRCIQFAKDNKMEEAIFMELDSYRKFVLNPLSHDSYDVPLYYTELEEALETFKKLHELNFDTVLTKGDKIGFELKDTTHTYRFEIVIQDELKLIKEPAKDSLLSKVFVNYKVYKDNVATTTGFQDGIISLEDFYQRNYDKSDKSKSSNFWDEITFLDSNLTLSTIRAF